MSSATEEVWKSVWKLKRVRFSWFWLQVAGGTGFGMVFRLKTLWKWCGNLVEKRQPIGFQCDAEGRTAESRANRNEIDLIGLADRVPARFFEMLDVFRHNLSIWFLREDTEKPLRYWWIEPVGQDPLLRNVIKRA